MTHQQGKIFPKFTIPKFTNPHGNLLRKQLSQHARRGSGLI